MCGITGLFLKDPALQPALGELTAHMLATLGDRGPDSAGIAIYGAPRRDCVKLTLRAPSGYDFAALARRLDAGGIACEFTVRATHAVLVVADSLVQRTIDWLAAATDAVDVVGRGRRLELFKEVGRPADVLHRFAIADMGGTHSVGHTRMATESAVTTLGSHPFSTGPDQCLVHNGSLSNHNGVRRTLRRHGYRFATENDTEVAAAYLSWRMRDGLPLDAALTAGLRDLDGFYTFVVGTETGFGVLRDPVACKPAMMAETERYVAFGSEYRALAVLPGIDQARLWEPEPAVPYFWQRG